MACVNCGKTKFESIENTLDLSYIIDKAKEYDDLELSKLSVVFYQKKFHLQVTLSYTEDTEKVSEIVTFGTVQ